MPFEFFPNTNFHDMNLDYILEKTQKIDDNMRDSQASADAAKASEEAAKASEDAAKLSEENAKASEEAAKDYSDHIADPVSGLVTGWLEENITQETGYALDASLTSAAAAAPAKTVGDWLRSIGRSVFSRNEAARVVHTTTSGVTGERIFVQLLKWTGGAFTRAEAIGILAGANNTVIGTLNAVGDSAVFTLNRNADSINVALNADTPTTAVELSVLVINLDNPTSSLQVIHGAISDINASLNTAMKTPRQATTNSTVLPDADNADPNSILAILNLEPFIANLPQYSGTLVTVSPYVEQNRNFTFQLFNTTNGVVWFRAKYSNTWRPWKIVNSNYKTLSRIPLASSQTKIALVGDSITQGQGSTGFVLYNDTIDDVTYSVRGNGPNYPGAGAGYQVGAYLGGDATRKWYVALDGNGWAQRLKAYLESKFNCAVDNLGMAGINSAYLVQHAIPDNVIGNGYSIAILTIGANDRQSYELQTLYSNLKSAVDLLQGDNIQVIITCYPPNSVSVETGRNFHMEDVEHIAMKVASEYNIPFIDVYGHFLEYCDYKDVSIDSLLADGLHPNDAGYDVIYNCITTACGIDRKRPGATW